VWACFPYEVASFLQVEGILFQHPAVLEAAVVAKPHPKWLETPVAFIALREGSERCTEEEILQWCRREMPRFMCPSRIVFGPLPKTATGKVQKYVLREEAKRMREAKQSRL
jgi:fatty-acyl-CoA synthase